MQLLTTALTASTQTSCVLVCAMQDMTAGRSSSNARGWHGHPYKDPAAEAQVGNVLNGVGRSLSGKLTVKPGEMQFPMLDTVSAGRPRMPNTTSMIDGVRYSINVPAEEHL